MMPGTRTRVTRLSGRGDLFQEVKRLRKLLRWSNGEIESQDEAILYLAGEVSERDGAILRMADEIASLREQLELGSDLVRERDETIAGLNRQSDEDGDALTALLDEAADRLSAVTADLDRATERNRYLEGRVAELSEERSMDDARLRMADFSLSFNRLPRSIPEVVDMARDVFSDLVVMSDSPYDRAKNFSRDQVDDAWCLVRSLPLMWHLLFGRGGDDRGDFVDEFRNLTGLRFSTGESSFFKKDSNRRNQRTFRFDGRDVVCMWHIGKMTHDYNTAIRCYFYPDSSIGKLRIGYVGLHR